MPYGKSYKSRSSSKYNSAQRSAYKKKQKYKAKKYRNRQQLLSIPTVKKLIKKEVEEHPEVKIVEKSDEQYETYHLGHPELYEGANSQLRCSPISTIMLQNSTITQGTAATQRVGEQIFLKGFRIKIRFLMPANINPLRESCDWFKIHWGVYRLAKGTSDTTTISEINSNPFTNSFVWNRNRSRPLLKFVQKGELVYRPKASALSKVDPTGASLLRDSICTRKSFFMNKYVKINKKFDMRNTSATGNPNPYKLLIYSTQQKQRLGADQKYCGEYDQGQGASAQSLGNTYTVRILGYKVAIYYTDC